jgi:hypothetical protein
MKRALNCHGETTQCIRGGHHTISIYDVPVSHFSFDLDLYLFAMPKDPCCMWVLMLPPEKQYLMSHLQRLNIRHRRDKKKQSQ